jgi:hypothetical protein
MSGPGRGDGESDASGSDRNESIVIVGLALAALLILAGGAFALGLVPGGSDGTAAGTSTATPVPTLAPDSSDDGGTTSSTDDSADTVVESQAGSTATTPTTAAGVTVEGDTRQFQFQVLQVESCGRTCRDVDVELTNSGDAAADVAATSRLYAGTAGDDKVWQGTEEIGDMAAGETVERTVRIQLSLVEASKVCGADTVTLVTDVVSAEHHQQFTSHPDIEC